MEMLIILIVLFIIIIIAFILHRLEQSNKRDDSYKVSLDEAIENLYSDNHKRRYKGRKWFYYNRKKNKRDISEIRLDAMESGSIEIKKIMNMEESKIYYALIKVFKNYNINTQVSFKAFLKAEEDTEAWKTFRDFYADFLITYRSGSKMNEPFAIIEYHGGGHYGDSEVSRRRVEDNDYIREKLFNKVGIKYFIIKGDDIKSNSKFIDDNKLYSYLHDILKVCEA